MVKLNICRLIKHVIPTVNIASGGGGEELLMIQSITGETFHQYQKGLWGQTSEEDKKSIYIQHNIQSIFQSQCK